jgi:hypothetical protein
MGRRHVTLAGSMVLLALTGCIGIESDEPIGEGTEDISAATVGTSCRRADILAATSQANRAVIDRGLQWVDDHIMYSQTELHDGWRRDCSGFVSMAWNLFHLKPGLVTSTFYERSRPIPWSDLTPGDALLRPAEHVMLFAGWANSSHTMFCVLEEFDYGHPASIRLHYRSSYADYIPIRHSLN